MLLCILCSAIQSDCSVAPSLHLSKVNLVRYVLFEVQWKLRRLNYYPIWLLWKHIWLISCKTLLGEVKWSDLVAFEQLIKNQLGTQWGSLNRHCEILSGPAVHRIIINAKSPNYVGSVKKSETSTHLLGSLVSFSELTCSWHDVSEKNIMRTLPFLLLVKENGCNL